MYRHAASVTAAPSGGPAQAIGTPAGPSAPVPRPPCRAVSPVPCRPVVPCAPSAKSKASQCVAVDMGYIPERKADPKPHPACCRRQEDSCAFVCVSSGKRGARGGLAPPPASSRSRAWSSSLPVSQPSRPRYPLASLARPSPRAVPRRASSLTRSARRGSRGRPPAAAGPSCGAGCRRSTPPP